MVHCLRSARRRNSISTQTAARSRRAHAALHLLVTAAAESYATFHEPPHVVGGGEARLVCSFREEARALLPKVVARAQQLAAARDEIVTKWAPREDAEKLVSHEPVALTSVAPGEPTLRLVQCGKRSILPCDAPFPAHTWEVGELELKLVQQRSGAVKFGVRVV